MSFLPCGQLLHLWPPGMAVLSNTFSHQNGFKSSKPCELFTPIKGYLYKKQQLILPPFFTFSHLHSHAHPIWDYVILKL